MWAMVFAILLIIAAVVVWDKYFKDTYLAEHDIRPDHYVIPAHSPMVSLELRRPGGSSAPIAGKPAPGGSAANKPEKSAPKVAQAASKAPAPNKSKPKKASAKTAGGRDDLTRIRGIGKVTAEKLADNGITTFKQLAALSDAEFDRLNEKIRFRGKVDVADWREQATKLV